MSLHEAFLYEKKKEGKVKCCLCARRCLISNGSVGFCLVRKNEGGTLYTLNYGKAVSVGVDPIGKMAWKGLFKCVNDACAFWALLYDAH